MVRGLRKFNRKRGNVTLMWVVALPVFMIIFMFLGSLVVVWMEHAIAEKAADAGSLAATKKMDGYVSAELQTIMSRILQENADNQTFIDPYQYVLGNSGLKRGIIKNAVFNNKEELIKEVRKYVEQNGAEPSRIYFFADGRIQVEAKVKFTPLIWAEEFANKYVKGTGFGPTRDYGSWWPNRKPLEVSFE
ncbi:TadE/TadG family type IV pilus assembly protein [Laceyella putida]|uniref:TadE/TadG family type IV pilus assembly protein n=1 Tax=Laceyella putida TaxID=110101 RepID=A0ABW2RQQ0_9BACL